VAAYGGKVMPNYRFRWLKADGTEDNDCLMIAANDSEAEEIARGLLGHSRHPVIEVWRQSTRLYQLALGKVPLQNSN